MNGAAYLSIIRPVNAVVAGLAGILASIIATSTIPAEFFWIFCIVLAITGAGNVINDYYDREIDAINQPDRPIPSGQIIPGHALIYAILLFLIGNGIAILFTPLTLAGITMVNSVLLWLYASFLKKTPLFGNISVSYLAASIFLFGGAIQGIQGIISVLPIAGATCGVMLARELIKDAEDMPGDKEHGARTFPLLYGIRATIFLALISAFAGVIMSLLLYSRWGPFYLGAILLVDAIILFGAIRGLKATNSEEMIKAKSSKILKAGMFASLLVFLLSAVVL
ncbi:geranylgeranylglycerol-phosphate geranylgeranyltransferase [Methanospirillum hungatei]|uniref:geranylgeranylglycerol-phosphate geranylgeranyltransferase n=1 Tax=Methanospirillum hungatei TaxID=2203 RepID=UPI0026EBCE87|nr:geranylgeranylglycerol-phosphate geranylgeranyltransferase [Methanospirillum hungatei]MCA1915737.1 geranylgeranylglycerol-phosphate geranylgeranyltransferase [Methanospirillum hungatei]